MTGFLTFAAFTAFAVSGLSTFLVLRAALARQLLMDAPNERSSHTRPKPRGGGAGVVVGLLAGVAVAAVEQPLERPAFVLLACACLCACIGVWDDLRGLSVGPRLAFEFGVATWMTVETGPLLRSPLPPPFDLPLGLLGYVFPVVWLVGVMNFFNFMDGIDGLAGAQAMAGCVAAFAMAWSPGASLLTLLLLAGLAGFLPFNWWPSRIFLGDVGSLPIGFLLAGFPLLAPPLDRHRAILAAAIGLTLFLLDPVLILWRRFRRGAPLGQPHREHLYQHLARPEAPHAPVTLALAGAGVVLSAAGAVAYLWPKVTWAAIALAAVTFAFEYVFASARGRAVR